VLLDFWATWCSPCAVELPWFMEFERKYKDRGFEVLGVAMDDDGWKVISPFVERKKFNYRVLLGDDKTGDQYGGIEALPSTYVIDRNGKIAAVHIGLTDKKDFEDAIQNLLEAPANAPQKNARDGRPGSDAAGNGAVRAGARADRRTGSHS
jgi:peroxiredoxin